MVDESRAVCEALAALCKEQGIACVVQVGAESGHEGMTVANVVGCSAVLIDGNPECRPDTGKTPFFNVVIGSSDCTVKFFVNKSGGLSGKIGRGATKEETLHHLPQSRLDTFCAQHNIKPDALIIDTEGTTMDVLGGCGDLLDDMRVIYAECQLDNSKGTGLHAIRQFLAERGFVEREGPPAYDCGNQGNYTWVKNE